MKKSVIALCSLIIVVCCHSMEKRKRVRSLPDIEIVEETSESSYTELDTPSSPERSPKRVKKSDEVIINSIVNSLYSVVMINHKDYQWQQDILQAVAPNAESVLYGPIKLTPEKVLRISAQGKVYQISVNPDDYFIDLQTVISRSKIMPFQKFLNPEKGGIKILINEQNPDNPGKGLEIKITN